MFKKLIPTSIAAALGLALMVAAPQASATEDVAGEIAVSGRILVDGQPTRAGEVMLLAWPNAAVLGAAAEGASIKLETVYTGQVASNGSFAATIDPSLLPASYRESDGMVGLQIFVTDGSRSAKWLLSVQHQGSRGWRRAGGDPAMAPPAALTFDLGAAPSVTDQDQVTSSIASAPMPKSGTMGFPPYCDTWNAGAWHYGIIEYFSRLHGSANAPARIVQSVGAGHTLGVGAAANYNGVGMKFGGTVGRVSGIGVDGAGKAASYRVYNSVNYRDFYVLDCGDYLIQRMPMAITALNVQYKLIPTPTWAGGCFPYSPGHTVTKETGTNSTMSLGVDIGPINVSAQSGWTTRIETKWYIVNTEHICGSGPEGIGQSPEARAK